ncbi:hypothetical protein [Streptomyces sp. NBC_01304]|uniref:hypothetical protein n=1 Tax=Streptomyces sp. NBC_01304 TaxID=2903818 RepID=UPI002E109BE5|nr:hypothetical protein OG430_13185 [Streptomyces sp. NBC_01304]
MSGLQGQVGDALAALTCERDFGWVSAWDIGGEAHPERFAVVSKPSAAPMVISCEMHGAVIDAPDQIAMAYAEGGSHAQVLAFSRTQAVNGIPPGTAKLSSWAEP